MAQDQRKHLLYRAVLGGLEAVNKYLLNCEEFILTTSYTSEVTRKASQMWENNFITRDLW